MGNFTAKENKILMPLVADCVSWGFTEKESLLYIETRFGRKVSPNAYYIRKRNVDSGEYATEWMNHFSKVGFVIKHQEAIKNIEMIINDAIKDYLIEYNKPAETRNETKIQQLRYEIREHTKFMQELSLGSPVIAQIKAKLEHAESISTSQ